MFAEGLQSRDEKIRRDAAILFLWALSPMHNSKDSTSCYPDKIFTHLQLSPATTMELRPIGQYYRYLWAPSTMDSVLCRTAKEHAVAMDPRTKEAVLCEFIVMLIRDGLYDARYRAGFRELGKILEIDPHIICVHEYVVAFNLEAVGSIRRSHRIKDAAEAFQNTGSAYRKWKIGAAAALGGAIMWLTMGMAAPTLIPAVGALFSAGATGATTVGLPAAVTSGLGFTGSLFVASVTPLAVTTLFAGAGAGLTGYKVAIRTGCLSEMEYCRLIFTSLELADLPAPSLPHGIPLVPHNPNLHITICIAGWILSPKAAEGAAAPPASADAHELLWRQNLRRHYVQTLPEVYYIKWESAHLASFGDLLSQTITKTLLQDGVVFWAASAASTALNAVLAAIVWPYWLLWSAGLIDSSFSIAIDRAEKAGILLAETLLRKAHGQRPVSLMAFSTGTTMVHSCLRELHRQGAVGLIDNVFLLGSTIVVDTEEWSRHREIVSGRFVNVYSSNDWFLAFLFRMTKFVTGLAGLQRVRVSGVENVDVSHIVESHLSYVDKIGVILEYISTEGHPFVDLAFDPLARPDAVVFTRSGGGAVMSSSEDLMEAGEMKYPPPQIKTVRQ